MIKLNIEPFCENCPYFEPDVEKAEIRSLFNSMENESIDFIYRDTIIRCEKRSICENIKNYLKTRLDNEENN